MSKKYSNNQIKKAGKILVYQEKYNSIDIEFAQDVLTYWRTIHAVPINTFQATLRDKINRLNFKDAIIAQRLKRAFSIISKLRRFRSMKMSTMQDIAGLRAILKNLEQVRQLEESYRLSSFKHILIDSKDYISTPADSGYRGIHLIYQYSTNNLIESDGLKIELQIRTKLQHIWATAVETMGAFLDTPLKSSIGPADWLEYFKLVSTGFCILEDSPRLSQYDSMSERDIFNEIVIKSIKLEVSAKLRGFTTAAEHIIQSKINYKYSLITLNLEKKTVNVKSYPANQLEKANVDYTNIEKLINRGAKLQSVLVSTNSIGSLRKAYPSYFLDSKEFLGKLNLIYKKLKEIEDNHV